MTAMPPQTPPPPPAEANLPPKTSGMAIAALICGLLGFLTAGLAGLIGIILGIIALSEISRRSREIRGKGLAVGGIISGGLSLVVTLIIAILIPTFAKARAQHTVAMSNMHSVATAMLMYSNVHQGRLPNAETWPEDLDFFLDPDVSLQHPKDNTPFISMNEHISWANCFDLPGDTVLLFECRPDTGPAGGLEDVAIPPRIGKVLIVRLDGTIQEVPPEEVASLRWMPEEE